MTRKFEPIDARDATNRIEKKNSEHVSSLAKETKALALTTAAAASIARTSIEASRRVLQQTLANPTIKSEQAAISDTSLAASRDATNREIIEATNTTELSDSDKQTVNQTVTASSRQAQAGFARRASNNLQKNSAVPTVETTEVLFNRKKGVSDGFFVKLRFSVNRGDVQKIKAFRIFRATFGKKALTRDYGTLSFHGVSRIISPAGRKNVQVFQMSEKRLIEASVANEITEKLPFDGITNLRLAYSKSRNSGSLVSKATLDSRKTLVASSFIKDSVSAKLDMSVATNLNVMKNIIAQDSSLKINVIGAQRPIVVANRTFIDNKQASTLQRQSATDSTLIIEKNNAAEFKEIGFFSPDTLISKLDSGTPVFEIEDTRVMFGETYMYFVSSISGDMTESPRSQIINVSIERNIPPAQPTLSVVKSSTYSTILCSSDDEFVERFEIFKKELSLDSSNESTREFELVGQTLSVPRSPAPFVDRSVRPGRSYLYRAYSVDCFGNKSHGFAEQSFFMQERGHRITDLKKPTILVELDTRKGTVRVSMTNDDDRIVALMLSRKDLTIRDRVFHTPSSAPLTILGQTTVKRKLSLSDAYMSDTAWQGYFPVIEKGRDVVEFTDTLTRFDKTYQYSVHGVDLYGNKTPPAVSSMIFVSRDPKINAPIAVSASFETDGTEASIKLSWESANLDIDPAEKIGNKETLSNNDVRTLFQVERKAFGQELWEQFPLTEQSFIEDKMSVEHAPPFRPPYPRRGATYQYRVAAFQSGSFISNFSRPVSVKAEFAMLPPAGLSVKTCAMTVRPFYVVLNWTKEKNSGTVDRWEVERVAINNIFAQNIDSRNTSVIAELPFEKFCIIGRESTRARPINIDEQMSNKRNWIFTDECTYIDGDIKFGNTYFYKIRSIGPDGSKSDWAYRGIRVTDSSTERLFSQLTNNEMSNLSLSASPVIMRKF